MTAVTHSPEIIMPSRVDAIAGVIERLRSDPEFSARIKGRETDFLVATREALINAVVHGNHYDSTRKVHIRYSCEPNGTLSISIRDEGDGFDPTQVPDRTKMKEDLGRGISLIHSSMDEVQFRRNGTEILMRLIPTSS